jgi:ferredoxin-NADP reductase
MKKTRHAVIEVINLTPETFILRLERKKFEFVAGQYVILREPGQKQGREYSIFSGTGENHLDFLIREIPSGLFSRYLRKLVPGSELDVDGPRGFFIPDQKAIFGSPAVFIATGTGISPFHSFIKSYPGINYTVVHGVKYTFESYGKAVFKADKHIICSSQDNDGNYMGRVTGYLKKAGIEKNAVYYLCGNAGMIDDVSTLLEKSGIKPENIRSEVYY